MSKEPGPEKGIEASLQEAIQRGEFDHLRGKGKPLNLDAYFDMPEELRVGYTLLKNAGFVPEEVELRREIGALNERLRDTVEEAARRSLGKRIRELQLKLDLLLERPRRRPRTE
jgi:hypothetical protein